MVRKVLSLIINQNNSTSIFIMKLNYIKNAYILWQHNYFSEKKLKKQCTL